MNIQSKNFVLLPRHLRRFNGCLVKLFDGRKGKIVYPYLMVSDGNSRLAVMIEKQENFKDVYQIISKGDKSCKDKILAQRKNEFSDLKVL